MHRKFGNKGLEKIHLENINQKNSHVSNISVNFLLCKIEVIILVTSQTNVRTEPIQENGLGEWPVYNMWLVSINKCNISP